MSLGKDEDFWGERTHRDLPGSATPSGSVPYRELKAPPPPALGGDEHTLPGSRGHTTLPSTWRVRYYIKRKHEGPSPLLPNSRKDEGRTGQQHPKIKHLPCLTHRPRAFKSMGPSEVFDLLSWSASHHL